MSKLSIAAAALADTLATLERQSMVFLKEAEAARRASQKWSTGKVAGGRQIVSEDRECARAWPLLNKAASSAVSRAHAAANSEPVPAQSVDLASVFKGRG